MSEPSEEEESANEVIVIGSRMGAGDSSGGWGVAPLPIIVRSGGTNDPSNRLVEGLRGLFDRQTDYDLDTRFTDAQKQIILTALRGLANHPVYGPAMAALAAKGADINIIADFSGEYTGSDLGQTRGRNSDGTIDQGESITIYINMNPGGAPVSNIGFSEVIVHELIHSLAFPHSTGRSMLRAHCSTGKCATRSSPVTISAPLPTPSSMQADVLDLADAGGALAGSGSYEIFSGSDFADAIAPGGGGSLVYSGQGDDRITVTLNGGVDEIIDSGGLDSIVLPAGTSLSSISMRWSPGQHDLAVMVNGKVEAIIVDAAGDGAVEQISVDGVGYALSAFAVAVNVPPDAVTINATVYDSFYGGFVASASVFDANGDALSYRIGDVTGDYAGEEWTIDADTGLLFGDFTRYAESGSSFTVVTVIVSDGLDVSNVTVSIRWANSGEYDTPIEGAFASLDEPSCLDTMLPADLWHSPSLDAPLFYG